MDIVQFVDSIVASPTLRLDLNNESPWAVTGVDFSPPPLKQAWSGTLLTDGERLTAAAYANRRLRLSLELITASQDASAAALQALWVELNRPSNLLRYQPDGASQPVFFRTLRSMDNSVRDYPGGSGSLRTVDVEIVAEPFALGLRETLPAVTVYNDPAEGTYLNADPYFEAAGVSAGGSNPGFESGTTEWFTSAGTIAASQDFVQVGAWAGKLTASGAANPRVTHSQSATFVTAGTDYTISGWLYAPVALPSTATITIQWYTAAGVFVSQNVLSTTLTASAWTYLEGSFTAPPTAERAARQFAMGGTPAAGVLLYGDDIQVRVAKPANWTGIGGTVVRSTAQAHEGVASLLLTPDGVTATVEARADLVPATAGQTYRASAWVRCAVSRSVAVGINWHESGGAFISQSVTSVAVTANTWTLLEMSATAPALTGQARLLVGGLSATPPASHLLWIDEARIRPPVGAGGGMCFDVTSPKGDVESPLFLQVRALDVARLPESPGTGRRQSAIAVRRGGTPSAMPAVLQAESMTAGTDTSAQPASGSSGTFLRTSFATQTSLQSRASIAPFPTSPSTDVRGTYRVFLRCRKSVLTDTVQLQTWYINGAAIVLSDLVTVPAGAVWRWVDMGLVQMPLGYDPAVDGLSGTPIPVGGMGVHVYAARTSGTGTLDLDTIMFVPADDRFSLVKWPDFTTESAYVVDPVAGQGYGVGSSGEVRAALLEMVGGPPMVSPGVANRIWMLRDVGSTWSAGDDVAGSMQVAPYYWPRYLHVRPVAS